MDQSINPITEKTANELCEAFRACNESMKMFETSFEQVYKSLVDYALSEAKANIALYKVKVYISNILIRWYWKRKLRRAEVCLSNLENFIGNER